MGLTASNIQNCDMSSFPNLRVYINPGICLVIYLTHDLRVILSYFMSFILLLVVNYISFYLHALSLIPDVLY